MWHSGSYITLMLVVILHLILMHTITLIFIYLLHLTSSFTIAFYKMLSASPPDPHQGLCPWTPLGALPPYRLALHALAMLALPEIFS